jgi:tetratricopeptide (TPR) repeat protein
MNSPRRVYMMAAAVLLVSALGAIVTLTATDHIPKTTIVEQELYLRSPKVLRRLCLGYSGLLADIYWTRAVQYFGIQHHVGTGDYRLLAPLLEATTELDPKLMPAYQFGANFLAPKPPNGAGLPGEALSLLHYGIEHNPDSWRLYYDLGFVYYTELKDYAKAADAFKRGAALPRTSDYMPILAARMAQHAVEHLLALQVDEEVTQLEQVIGKYRAKTGHLPATMNDLDRAGFIHGTPLDPKGNPYQLTAGGDIRVKDPQTIYFITKGLPPGMGPPQPPQEETSQGK